jgi:hypothetical protein
MTLLTQFYQKAGSISADVMSLDINQEYLQLIMSQKKMINEVCYENRAQTNFNAVLSHIIELERKIYRCILVMEFCYVADSEEQQVLNQEPALMNFRHSLQLVLQSISEDHADLSQLNQQLTQAREKLDTDLNTLYQNDTLKEKAIIKQLIIAIDTLSASLIELMDQLLFARKILLGQ